MEQDLASILLEARRYITEVGVWGFIDMGVMSVLLYAVLVWFKRTKSLFVLVGILMMSGLYFLAQLFNMQLTTAVLNGFFAVILVAMVVIFQEELRHFFEQIALWGIERGKKKEKGALPVREEVSVLVRTLSDLARGRVGALVVLRRHDALGRHIEGGVELGGRLSEPLLKSIFDPHSIGHDGAVVIEGGRVACFSAHLPLSKNIAEIRGGTRHAAALGLSERTDALALVVSEERGAISVAAGGRLLEVTSEELARELGRFYAEVSPSKGGRSWYAFFSRNNLEKIVAVTLSGLLWFVFVHESVPVYRTYTRAVKRIDLAEGLSVKNVKPAIVRLTFSGPRRAFYFADERKVTLNLKLYGAHLGMNLAQVSPSSVSAPPGIQFENSDPSVIRVWVETMPKEANPKK